MDTIAISDLRTNLPSIIDEVNEKISRVIITVSGKPKAVVLSLEEIESLEETADILSAPDAYRRIKEGERQARKRQGVLLSQIK